MIKIQSQDFIYIDVGYALKDKEMAQYDKVQKKYLVHTIIVGHLFILYKSIQRNKLKKK